MIQEFHMEKIIPSDSENCWMEVDGIRLPHNWVEPPPKPEQGTPEKIEEK